LASFISEEQPSLTVLVNGGEVAFRDAAESVQAGRPVMVIRGSGRTADIIADALDGKIRDERAKELADSGYVGYLDLAAPIEDALFTIGDFFV
jgi:hypothetical protein